MGIDVLIVDDLTFIKMVLRDLVEKAGFRVVGEASDGIQALDQFQEKRPDVVLLDITMPNMDGLTTLKKMLEMDPQANIIMCSALGQQQLILQIGEAQSPAVIQERATDWLHLTPISADHVTFAPTSNDPGR